MAYTQREKNSVFHASFWFRIQIIWCVPRFAQIVNCTKNQQTSSVNKSWGNHSYVFLQRIVFSFICWSLNKILKRKNKFCIVQWWKTISGWLVNARDPLCFIDDFSRGNGFFFASNSKMPMQTDRTNWLHIDVEFLQFIQRWTCSKGIWLSSFFKARAHIFVFIWQNTFQSLQKWLRMQLRHSCYKLRNFRLFLSFQSWFSFTFKH